MMDRIKERKRVFNTLAFDMRVFYRSKPPKSESESESRRKEIRFRDIHFISFLIFYCVEIYFKPRLIIF